MLWNWHTIDACFLTSSWHIKSYAMFACTCIGVVLLVVAVEFLRRVVKEYDAYLIRKHSSPEDHRGRGPSSWGNSNNINSNYSGTEEKGLSTTANDTTSYVFQPSSLEQAARALLHTLQLVTTYFAMR